MARVIIKTSFERYVCALIRAQRADKRVAVNTCSSEDLMEKVRQMSPSQRAACGYYLVTDDTATVAGFAVMQGELVGLFSTVKGLGDWLVRHAIQQGAFRLNCFDGYLVKLYERHRFEEYSRMSNWVAGEPEVVYMRLH